MEEIIDYLIEKNESEKIGKLLKKGEKRKVEFEIYTEEDPEQSSNC